MSRDVNRVRLSPKTIKREIVTPLDPNQGIRRCAFVDQLANLRMIPNISFCYRERLDAPRLKQSLAQILNEFSAYAGRLACRDGDWVIERGTQGVVFEVAESEAQSSELNALGTTESTAFDSRLFCPRIPVGDAMRGKAGLIAARITHIRDGSVLGITYHHMAGDIVSTMEFLRAWAHAYRGEPYDEPLEVDDFDEYVGECIPNTANGSQKLPLSSWGNYLRLCGYVIANPAHRIIIDFPWSDISIIRAEAERNGKVSVNDTLAAYVFTTIGRLRNTQTESTLGLSVNTRQRLGLPANFLGNPVDVVHITTNPRDSLAAVASTLRSTVQSYTTDRLRHSAVMAFKAETPSKGQRLRFGPTFFHLDPFHGNLLFASLLKLGLYKLVFEKTPPSLVKGSPFGYERPMSWYANIIEGVDNSGVTMEVWLPSKLARRLKQEMSRPPLEVLRDNEIAA
jgi:hypothetical protein